MDPEMKWDILLDPGEPLRPSPTPRNSILPLCLSIPDGHKFQVRASRKVLHSPTVDQRLPHYGYCPLKPPFHPAQIRQTRLYLQVHTIADLGTAGGTHVDRAFIHGETTVTSSTSAKELEITQHRPDSALPWNQWKRACDL
ncbi:hypothetical protein IV203_016020 [Nitzschia inconspicua]|uniref:Uncharacterized protein n=1 Tax=Nitzschia inconspicua TaxID=303405 RepID=A0A9K3KP54_9STRA|nr:hypothetical protein IV203_016020 [Nitzschia inconspicua]